MTDDLKVVGYVDSLEESFFDQDLLKTSYLRRMREHYEDTRGTPFINRDRCYPRLLELLQRIHSHDEGDARRFVRRLKQHPDDHTGCESVFAEVIVYAWYVPLVGEGAIRALRTDRDECDVIIDRVDGTAYFLEVFCVMPDFKPNEQGIVDIKTHSQNALSSIRQKLLRKVHKQGQLTKPRENWVVVELNSPTIAGDFAVLSSLSSGYKVQINTENRQIVGEGYDWASSVFDDDATKWLKGVIWFSLGDYEGRRMLLNRRYGTA